MKRTNRIWILSLFMIGTLLIFFGCKKEDTKKDPIITWANPTDINYGTLLSATQLNATADVPGTFVYTPAIGVKLNVGTNQDLKVDFTPTSTNYNVASKTVKINVIASGPVITWENPLDICFGTLLSTTQLNATADVPGTFVYSPAIGVKLDVGANQDLKVDFTPTDVTNYNKVSKTVKINVLYFNPNLTYGSMTDQDGNTYKTITIGTQIWMAENLRTTKYNDGTGIPNVTDDTAWGNLTTPAYCWYNNDAATNKAIYGTLYNWYTVNTGKLAPIGWHVPTDAEWTTLINYLIANGYNYDGTTIGDRNSNNKIAKALASTTGWSSSWFFGNCDTCRGTVINTDYPAQRNATGFTAIPGGLRGFNGIGNSAFWWSASDYNVSNAYYWYLYYFSTGLSSTYSGKSSGFSVRCVRD